MFFSPISEILGKVSDAEFEIWNAKIAKVVWCICLIITNTFYPTGWSAV